MGEEGIREGRWVGAGVMGGGVQSLQFCRLLSRCLAWPCPLPPATFSLLSLFASLLPARKLPVISSGHRDFVYNIPSGWNTNTVSTSLMYPL